MRCNRMSYLTPVDQTVLLALAIGFCNDALTGCLEAGLNRWIEKTGRGWGIPRLEASCYLAQVLLS
jgi:hypothetical protein